MKAARSAAMHRYNQQRNVEHSMTTYSFNYVFVC